MNIRKVSDKVYQNTEDRARMERMNEVYYRMADHVKKLDPNMYEMFVEEAEDIAYYMSRQDAEDIVLEMRPYGQHWSYEEVKSYVTERGVEGDKVCDYYLVMNMAYNDFNRTAKQYGLDRPEFYYDVAWDFINDQDGPRHKVAKYFAM